MQRSCRLKRELSHLAANPKDGISCYPKSTNYNILSASIIGPRNSPYEGGVFQMQIEIPEQYPFEPPHITFLTPVYHPNIDNKGRICMDLLNMPPKGGWKPTITIENLLDAVCCLLGNPNSNDPLMAEIAEEYQTNNEEFERKARKLTLDVKNKLS